MTESAEELLDREEDEAHLAAMLSLWEEWQADEQAQLSEAQEHFQSLKVLSKEMFLTYEEIQTLPDPEWLLEGWLERDSLAMLYAPSGAGKSFVALHWSLLLAQKGEDVLYVVSEGVRGTAKRVQAWLSEYGPIPEGGGSLTFGRQSFAVDDLFKQAAPLYNKTVELQPSLIVIDTLARNMQGDENATHDANLFIQGLDALRLASPDSCVLVVHHTGKDPDKGARGSSVIRAAMDTEIYVKKLGSHRTLNLTKQKNDEDGLNLAFNLMKNTEYNSLVYRSQGYTLPTTTEETTDQQEQPTDAQRYEYMQSNVRDYVLKLKPGAPVSGTQLQQQFQISKYRWDTTYAPNFLKDQLLRTEGRRYYRT